MCFINYDSIYRLHERWVEFDIINSLMDNSIILGCEDDFKIIMTKIPYDNKFSLGCDVAYGKIHEFPMKNIELEILLLI